MYIFFPSNASLPIDRRTLSLTPHAVDADIVPSTASRAYTIAIDSPAGIVS